MIKELMMSGLRGFALPQVFIPAIPTGNTGSGLTFLIGANNSGKTTITEAITAFNSTYQHPSFSEGKRNDTTGRRVHLSLTTQDGFEETCWEIKTTTHGGSSTLIFKDGQETSQLSDESVAYILKSRRFVNFEFGYSEGNREQYLHNSWNGNLTRSADLPSFESRLIQMDKRHDEIDRYLQRIFGKQFDWTLEQRDSGNYYLKIKDGAAWHTLEGAGDGIWSVFTICDALYDANKNSTIVIDEPELSLHPALQKRTLELLEQEAKYKQIIICTHSPFFISWPALENGAALIRVEKDIDGSCLIHPLSDKSKKAIRGLSANRCNPHSLGLEAKEAFFLEDNVIVCEGQDDVVYYQRFPNQIGVNLMGSFFGWGAGGADNISTFLRILQDLGFRKVVALFDGDVETKAEKCRVEFPEYKVLSITAEDVRDKKPVSKRQAVSGLAKIGGMLKDEYRDEVSALFSEINDYFEH